MKIIFAGTPEFAVPVLEALCESGVEIVAVLTQEDKPVGRKQVLTPPPVKVAAENRGIKVLQFKKLSEHEEEIAALGADIMITCAYGKILSKSFLQLFKGGVWNIHASLLPKYRGASPIQSAILGGETYTGVTVMRTEEALDSGDILLVKRTEINGKTYGELSNTLSELGAIAAVEAVRLLEEGNIELLMQDEGKATYCKKIETEDAKLDFTRSSRDIRAKIAAFNPSPIAFCNLNGVRLNIYEAEECEANGGKCGEIVVCNKHAVTVKCGDGGINILKAQLSGGKVLDFKDLVNGRKLNLGDILD